jgi:tetratricopeptide (TPR) repeat protein
VRAETRYQLKHDRFAEVTGETVHWAVEHRKTITILGLLAVIAVGAILGSWYYLQIQDQKASLEMAQALRTYDAAIVPAGTPPQPGFTTFTSVQERARTAQGQFRTIAQKYRRTRSGEIARYFAALTDVDLGNEAAAEKEFKEIYGSHNQDLAALAKLALANQYRNSGRDAEAIALYKQLIEHPTRSVGKAEVQFEMAALYKSKQPAEAKKIYEQIRKDTPAGPAAEMASAQLQDMK